MKTCPVSVQSIAGVDVSAPEGVSYSGARVEGSYIILRYVNLAQRNYVDRYFASGIEVMREVGNIVPTLWQRVFGD